MKVTETKLDSCLVLEPNIYEDERGFFLRLYDNPLLKKLWKKRKISQVNQSISVKKGTIRGIHFQYFPDTEAKIVRCLNGSVLDLALDLRPNSPTFLKYHSTILSRKRANALFIPEGCGQAYQALENNVHVIYFHSGNYVPKNEGAVKWSDKLINVKWPTKATVISNRDKNIKELNNLEDAKKKFQKFKKYFK